MNAHQLHEEIKEANLSYMMLAKQMINDDKASAVFRLGISEEMADLLSGLTPAQLLKMAGSNMLLCAFRFDERLLLNMVTDYNKDRMMSQSHATILMRHVRWNNSLPEYSQANQPNKGEHHAVIPASLPKPTKSTLRLNSSIWVRVCKCCRKKPS